MTALREAPSPHLSGTGNGVYADDIENILDQATKLADSVHELRSKAGNAKQKLQRLIEAAELALDDLNRKLAELDGIVEDGLAGKKVLTSRGCLRYFGGFVTRVADGLQQFQETRERRDLERVREDCLELKHEADAMRRILRRMVY